MGFSHRIRMSVILLATAGMAGAVFFLLAAQGVADHHEGSAAKFDSEGNLLRPTGYREWVFVGTPLTPNDMNGGMAPFPEFHAVYIDPAIWAHYKKTDRKSVV